MKRPFTASPRLLAIGLWLGFIVFCLAVVAQTRFTADLSAFLPKSPTPEQQLLVDQLKDGVVSRLILVGIEGADPLTHARLSKGLARRLRADPQFTAASNGESVNPERDRELVLNFRYHLSPATSTERFSAAGLQEAIGNSLDLLASPAGMLLKPVFLRDPTGEMVELLSGLDSGQRPASQHGVWMSKAGERALLLAQTRANGSDTDAQAAALLAIRSAFAAARQEVAATAAGAAAGTAADTTRLRLSGTSVFSVNARTTIESEATRLALLSAAIISGLLLLIYRSFTALALGLLPVLTGALAGVMAVSLGFGMVHGITIAFGATLIGESVDYAIYLFVQRRHNDQSEWLKTFWPTIRLGVLTSLAGFVALLFSGFPGLAQLGLYSISGLVAAALFTRFVLPHLLPAGFAIRDVTPIGQGLADVIAGAHRRRLHWAVLALAIAAAGLLASRHDDLWNRELSALSPVSVADQANDALLRGDLGAPDMRYLIVVTGPSVDAALAGSEKLAPHLQKLIDNAAAPAGPRSGLAHFDSPHRVLPSVATQQARIAALPTRGELQQRLPVALKELPIAAARLTPFLDDIDAARQLAPLRPADLQGTSLGLAADSMLVRRDAQWAALMPLRAQAQQEIDANQVRRAIADSGVANTWLVDLKDESGKLYAGYLSEATLLSAGGAAAIVILLLVALRSPERVLRIVLPLLATLLVVNAGLSLIGERLTLLHLVGMLLIVAVGSNYALFFARPRGENIAPRTLASLLLANLTTVAGFGLLAFSSVPILKALGITVGPGALLALIFSALLAPRQEAHGQPA
ncbi:MAG TPA: MMPL family transporter, partial [Rhodocyclaceae bacterium]|nr:MMPL family transporter [Rhodocyclaceae bacterium]